MKQINKKRLFVLNNLFIFIMTAIFVPVTLIFGSLASRKDGGPFAYWQHIVTFTILSNILLGIVALIAAFIGYRKLKDRQPLPKKLLTWYLVSTTSGMLTVLTVILFLAPMRAASGKNYFDMILGPMFFLHFFNPVLAAITYTFLSGNQKTTKIECLLSLLPPIIYAVPYFVCVVIIHIWPDFYGLTFGGQNHLIIFVCAVFCAIVYGISSLLAYCHNRQIALK